MARVQPLAPRHASCGNFDVRTGVDDDRALAAEFQRDGREVLRGGGHDDAADGSVARVEDVIEVLRQEFGGFGNSTFDQRDGRLVEVFRNETRERSRRGSRDFRRLHHHGIACCDGTRNRNEKQLDRVVPRCDDENDTEGFGNEARLRWHCDEGSAHAARLVPLLQVLQHHLHFGDDVGDVGEVTLGDGLAEVRCKGGLEFAFVLFEHADHCLELPAAPCEGTRDPRAVRGPQSSDLIAD